MQMQTARAGVLLLCLSGLLAAAYSKECAPGCVKRGNCNADDGTCQCMFGWTGPTCEEPIFPACQQNETDRPNIGMAFPKNCECFIKAFKYYNCGHGKLDVCQFNSYLMIDKSCFKYEGVEDKDQRSFYPEPGRVDQPRAHWYWFSGPDTPLRSIPEQEQNIFRDVWNTKHRALPLHACPGSCSHNGVCIRESLTDVHNPPKCLCHKGYLTAVDATAPCGIEDMSICPNKCLGRGRCIVGFCHCEPPYWGPDCGRDKPAQFNPKAVPPRTKVLIYMYDLPHYVTSPIAMDDGNHDRLDAHMAYELFNEQLLNDTVHRTLDPNEANLFYVPAHTYSFSSNTGHPGPHLEVVLGYVRQTWPWFNCTGGKDHIVWTPGDRGACYLEGITRDVIKLTHFGYHIDRKYRHNISYMTPDPRDPHIGCFHPLRDVVTPPLFTGNLKFITQLYDKIVQDGGKSPERNLLFFFAGTVRPHQPFYSGGARQAVHKLLVEQNETGADISDIHFTQGRIHDYFQLHMETKFCLCPHGAGFGMRLVMAMQYACIPVIISDLVFQPLEDALPYHEFSIRIPNSQLPQLITILRTITLQEQATLRLGMARWYKAFLWDAHMSGQAYNYTISSLHKRLMHLWGNMYK